MERRRIPFARFLSGAFEGVEYSTDDTIALLLPLFRKVHRLHEAGQVAPFEREDALFFSDGVLDIDETLAHPPFFSYERIQALFPGSASPLLEVVSSPE